MGFLLFIFLLIILVPLAILLYGMLWMRRTANRVRKAFSQEESDQEQEDEEISEKPKGKIFSSDVGEYVDFEEIADSDTADDTNQTQIKNQPMPDYSVSDAKYEELKEDSN